MFVGGSLICPVFTQPSKASTIRQLDSLPEADLVLELDPGAQEVYADA